MKKCYRCGEEKMLTAFYAHKAMGDGYLNKCKECCKKDNTKNRSDNLEYYRQYDRDRAYLPKRVAARDDYAKSKKGKESQGKAKKAWSDRNKIKRAATLMVSNAIRSGKLFKPEVCECCGSKPKRIHGHHDDYFKPLDVRWLCPGCHAAWHKVNGSGLNG